jgi:hypothetical protein
MTPSGDSTPRSEPQRSRRSLAVAVLALAAAILGTGLLLSRRAQQKARAEELIIVEGVRKVCKLSTVEIALAD